MNLRFWVRKQNSLEVLKFMSVELWTSPELEVSAVPGRLLLIFFSDVGWCPVFADLVKRHAGVLGLSACILSSPYDVPTWMPQLLMDLSAHLNDPQPIEVKMQQFSI